MKEKALMYLEEFEEDRRAFYPKRGGTFGLKSARIKYIQIRKDFTRTEVAQAFERYKNYCDKLNYTKTTFVQKLSTFLNDDENITCDWEVVVYGQQDNGSASRMFERCRTAQNL